MNGFTGRIAAIDLNTCAVTDYPLDDKDYELYLGGKSLAAKIIYDTLDGKVEAFSEENVIVITTAVITGSTSPCSSRFNVSTISPLTGLLISSNCGGSFGLHLKRAGYDGLVISGRSNRRVYIDVRENSIDIKSADHLWGLNTGQAQVQMGEKNRGKIVIGIAGENRVRYAAAISEERAAGRGGVGAVFGYKNLKGIIASGKRKMVYHNQKKFKANNVKWIKLIKKHPITGELLPKFGTAGLLNIMQHKNLLVTKNYTSGSYDDYDKISGEALRDGLLIKNKGCITCPIQCGRVVTAYGKTVKGPELETLSLLGSNLLNNDLQNIINLNHLCDAYGIDTNSFGNTVGFAMELNEKGLWDNGLRFSDNTQLEDLVKQIAFREGIGNDLAEGTKRISEKYGGKGYAMHVKGLELVAYEPRTAQGMGLGYATSNRGGCHLNGGFTVCLEGLVLNVDGQTTKGKAGFTVLFQDLMEAISASGSCVFTSFTVFPALLIDNPKGFVTKMVYKVIPSLGGMVGWLHNNTWLMNFNIKSLLPHPYIIKMITGYNMTIGKYMTVGERGYNLERLVNIRQGVTAADDTLPNRLTKELKSTDDPESKVKLEEMIQTYYSIRGWDTQGVPTRKRLKKLGLEFAKDYR